MATLDPTPTSSPTTASPFAHYRSLVPIASTPGTTYLNASYSQPSNLITHAAITSFAHNYLHNPHPKPAWQATASSALSLAARLINASPTDVVFTRDTTEGLAAFARALKFTPGDNVVLLESEHPNHVYVWMALRAQGLEVRQVPTKTGDDITPATAETFAPYVDDRTRAIGLSTIMFESGLRNDVAGICAAFRPRGIHVLADVTQQVGFARVDVQAWGVSAAAFSLHKGLNCPTGLACLWMDADVVRELEPVPATLCYSGVENARADLVVGGEEVVMREGVGRYERGNLSLVSASVAEAYLKFYLDTMGVDAVEEHLYGLGEVLRQECKQLGVGIVGCEERERHAPHLYILKLTAPGWAEHLRKHGVYVTGYRLGIRVSFGFYNNADDVKQLGKVLKAGLDDGLVVD